MLKELVYLANNLDQRGLHKEADLVDSYLFSKRAFLGSSFSAKEILGLKEIRDFNFDFSNLKDILLNISLDDLQSYVTNLFNNMGSFESFRDNVFNEYNKKDELVSLASNRMANIPILSSALDKTSESFYYLKNSPMTLRKFASIIVSGAIALGYIISPVDIIPDVILGVGWIDDVFSMSYILSYVAKIMDKKNWKEYSVKQDKKEDLLPDLDNSPELFIEDSSEHKSEQPVDESQLIDLANYLDSKGLFKEADLIDSIVKNSGIFDSMMGFLGGGKDSGPKKELSPPSEEDTSEEDRSEEDRNAQLIRMKQNKIKALTSSEDITEHYMNQKEIEKLKREIAQLELGLSGEEETPVEIDLPDFSIQALLKDQEMPELLVAVYNSDDEKAKAYLTGGGIYNLDSFKSFLRNYLSKQRGDALRLLNELAKANKLYQREATKTLFNFSKIPVDFDQVTFDLATDEKEIERMVLEYNPNMSEEEAKQRVWKFLTTVPDFSEEIDELRDSFTRRRRMYGN